MANDRPAAPGLALGAALGGADKPARKSGRPRIVRILAVIAVMLLGLRIAGGTVPREVQAGDNGEMQLVLREMGVAHPPGYPLYSLTGHLFGRVATQPAIVRALAGQIRLDGSIDVREPSGGVPGADTWSWATNLYSALLAIITLALVGYAAGNLGGNSWAGLVAVVVLHGSATFEAQSLVANIRMPTALFTAALLCLLIRFAPPPAAGDRAKTPGAPARRWSGPAVPSGNAARRAFGLGLVVSLALGHHGSLVGVALPVVLAVVAMNGRAMLAPRPISSGAFGFAIGLLPQAYLPWRDATSSLPAPADLTTGSGLWEHVSAAGFRGDMLAFTDRAALAERLPAILDIVRAQFGPFELVIALAAIGGAWLLLSRPAAAMAVGGAGLLTGAAGLTYRAPQTMEYLLPAYVALAVLAGTAVGAAASVGRRVGGGAARFGSAAAGVISLGLLGPGILFHQSVDEAAAAQTPRVAATFANCIPGGTVLASWHYWAPLEYAARHLAARNDLSVVYVYPDGDEPIGSTWLRRLRETDDVVVLTDRPREVIDAPVPLWPVANTPFFSTRPQECGPAASDESRSNGPVAVEPNVTFGDVVRLRSVNVASTRPDTLLPVEATFYFEPIEGAIPGELTVFAQLEGAISLAPGSPWTRGVIGQVDLALSAAQWANPEGLSVRTDLVPYRGRANPPFELIVGLYRTGPNGLTRLATTSGDGIPPWPERAPESAPTTAQVLTLHYWDSSSSAFVGGPGGMPASAEPGAIPFGEAMTLIGTSVAEDGAELVVDLTWRSDNAYDSDYHVSVQAQGTGWRAQHDGVPVLGMVPTLKWLPGMVFHDRHRVPLPDGADLAAGYDVRVSVYDGFTLEPLPVTDRARVEAGEGQQAVVFRRP